MSSFTTFRDMVVWQQSFNFAKGVQSLVKRLPQEERYQIANQLIRAAVSLPAQIAQGQRKRGRNEFVKHLMYAQGNAAECETYLLLLEDLVPDEVEEVHRLRETNTIIQKMLGALTYAIEHPKQKKSEVQSEVQDIKEPQVVAVTA